MNLVVANWSLIAMKHRKQGIDRKAMQLCSQVRWAIDYSINEYLDAADAVMVAEVLPAPNTSHLLVIVEPLEILEMDRLRKLETQIAKCAGPIRGQVAEAINRRKTPNLSFAVRPKSLQQT